MLLLQIVLAFVVTNIIIQLIEKIYEYNDYKVSI